MNDTDLAGRMREILERREANDPFVTTRRSRAIWGCNRQV